VVGGENKLLMLNERVEPEGIVVSVALAEKTGCIITV